MDIFARLRTDDSLRLDDISDLAVTSSDGHTLLQEAIVWKPEHAMPLIDAGAPLDHQDKNGQTALHYAVARSLNEIALTIIKKGVSPDILDKYGNNALWMAVLNPKPNYELAEALFKLGVDKNHKNLAGRSVVDMAKTKKNQRMLEILEE